jgi:ankyrin repeat protein
MHIGQQVFWGWAAWLLASSLASAADPAPLADAAQKKERASLVALLDGGASVNASQADGMTALHWAVYHDDLEMATRLLNAGADAAARNRYGVTPLWLACRSGDGSLVERLLEAGADPNATVFGGQTMLMTAARTGRLGAVKALLARGANVDAREDQGQTALMWAAADGHVDVVAALVEAGADYRTPLPSGFTPLLFAVREGRIGVVQRLIEAGAEINEPMQPRRRPGQPRGRATTALFLAVENGHFELAVALLDSGADPNARPGGYTALHAISTARKPIRGDGDPPPQGSGNVNSLDVVRQLARHGADLNVRLERGTSAKGRFTTTGSTAFLMASRAGDLPLMKLLVELGADDQLPNADNCTPLLAAAGVGALGDGDEAAATDEESIEAVKMLLDLGADINAVDNNGETAMHGAAYQSRPKLVQFLADHGADIVVWNRQNVSGWTPYLIAQGHRPGNFRPAPNTLAAVERVMRAAGVTPPPPTPHTGLRKWTE